MIAGLSVLGVAVFLFGQGRGVRDVDPPRADPHAAGPALCTAHPVREACSVVEAQGRSWRYALLPAERSEQAIIVDPGGPGLAILSGVARLGEFASSYPELSRLSEQHSLLFLEEPWVTRELDDACRRALRSFYEALRSAPPSAPLPAEQIVHDCRLGTGQSVWGFSPRDYQAVLGAIEQAEGIDIVGFVGLSFGSARWSYLEGDTKLEWATLVRPFPVGVSGTEIVARRAEMIEAIVEREAKNLGPATAPPPTTRARSLPVTDFDRASARVALGYLDPVESAELAPGVLNGQDTEAIGSLSDDLWQRYGETDLSPAYLAYLDEVCTIAQDWPAELDAVDTVVDVLTAAHLPCQYVPYSSAAPRSDATPPRRTCLVLSPNDPVSPVAPLDLIENGVAVVEARSADHGSVEGLDECLRRVVSATVSPRNRP